MAKKGSLKHQKEAQAPTASLLRFHDHRGEGWHVHTEEVSISIAGDRATVSGHVYDPGSMAYGDGQTNEYDWASVEISTSELIDGLTRVSSGEPWQREQMSFTGATLSVGNSSLYSPGPATAQLSKARTALLFLDAHEAVFSTLEQARTGTRLPARTVDALFLQSLRANPEHVARLGQVGMERTVQALLQEVHLDEIRMARIGEDSGLWLVEAGGGRETMLLSVQTGPDEKIGLSVVDRINGLRDRKMVTKAAIVTRSGFSDDVFHSYAGQQERLNLVDYDRLIGTLTDAGWTTHAPGFLTLPVANRPRRSVFISYSHANRGFAIWLYNYLHGWGYDAFLDDVDLRAGDVILSALQQALSGVDAVLLCCSSKALESSWVRAEIEHASARERVEGKSIVVPLDLDGALGKIDQVAGVPPYMLALRERLAVDFRDWDPARPADRELGKIRKALESIA